MTTVSKAYSISDSEYEFIHKLVYEHSGICFTEDKRDFILSRLYKYLKDNQICSFSEYCRRIKSLENTKELETLIDALTTNYTYFFREIHHYNFIKQILLKDTDSSEFKIWCAGCSTGDEAYSLGILFDECLEKKSINWSVLCSDISTRALEIAKEGWFFESQLRNVNEILLEKYFIKKKSDYETRFYINPQLRKNIAFKHENLVHPVNQYSENFDLIFCRNVMIYFDQATISKLVNNLYKALKPGGHLFVGSSESIRQLKTPFHFIAPTIYQKPLCSQ